MTNQKDATINCLLIIKTNLEISIISSQLMNYAKNIFFVLAMKPTKKQQQTNVPISDQDMETEGGTKFGWIKGVLMRCILNIWGDYHRIYFQLKLEQAFVVCLASNS